MNLQIYIATYLSTSVDIPNQGRIIFLGFIDFSQKIKDLTGSIAGPGVPFLRPLVPQQIAYSLLAFCRFQITPRIFVISLPNLGLTPCLGKTWR